MGLFDNIFDGVSALIGPAYSIYQDQRNYNYQKDLQEKLWERDDNAIQRKMADYAAAGVNPLMVASAGGAGNTSAGVGAGEKIQAPKMTPTEMKIEREKAKQEEENTKFTMDMNKVNQKLANIQLDIMKRQNWLDQMQFYNQIGMPYEFGYRLYTNVDTGKSGTEIGVSPDWRRFNNGEVDLGLPSITSENMPLKQMFNNTVSISDLQRQMYGANAVEALNNMLLSNKDLKWDTANRVLDFTLGVTGAYKDLLSPFNINKSNIYRR